MQSDWYGRWVIGSFRDGVWKAIHTTAARLDRDGAHIEPRAVHVDDAAVVPVDVGSPVPMVDVPQRVEDCNARAQQDHGAGQIIQATRDGANDGDTLATVDAASVYL